MEIEIYLDSLFLMNYLINLWILQMLKRSFSLQIPAWRSWSAACIGAGIYIMQFLIRGNALAVECISVVSAVPIMIGVFLPKRKRRYFLSMLVYGFFYSFLLAGIARAVLNKLRIFTGKETTLFGMLLLVFFCKEIFQWALVRKKQKHDRVVYSVRLKSADTCFSLQALFDTGNSLVEPISKKPVCIMEEEMLAKITLENTLFLRAIPYRSVGCQNGILYGVEVPEMEIITEDACYVAEHVICAGVSQKLSSKNAYQMILHPSLLTEENKRA